MTPTIDTVVFDLDDTLYDESTFVHAALEATANFVAAHAAVDRHEVRDAMDRCLRSNGRGRVFDRVAEQFALDAGLVPAMVHTYRMTRPELTLFPDADVVLSRLQAAGLDVGIVTDGMAVVQRNKVSALGLDCRIDAIVYTGALPTGMGKPSTGGFEAVLAMLDARPESSCYVGNDVTKDFIGPRRLRMLSIMLDRHVIGDPADQPRASLPDHIIENFADLPELLGIDLAPQLGSRTC